MTGLTDALRERLSRRGRTARADCGALGAVTVEALSPGDCAALLRGSGGKRAVLYAACRELQRAYLYTISMSYIDFHQNIDLNKYIHQCYIQKQVYY